MEQLSARWMMAAACLCGLCTMSRGQTAAAGAGHGEGIWKSAVPAKVMHGEFDNLDPLGVAAGARIKTDCSLNWIDPDDGKRYCFSSGTSLEFFLDGPRANLARAHAAWRTMAAAEK